MNSGQWKVDRPFTIHYPLSTPVAVPVEVAEEGDLATVVEDLAVDVQDQGGERRFAVGTPAEPHLRAKPASPRATTPSPKWLLARMPRKPLPMWQRR